MPLLQGDGVGTDDPLASWNDGTTKKSILDFVARVTKAGGKDFVTPEERIATFDNDGTLWSEQPYPFQFAFALDRVKALAPQHPEWQDKEPFKSVLAARPQGNAFGRIPCAYRDGRGHPFRHDDRRIRGGSAPMAGDNAPSENQQAVHRNGVPADAGAARLSPGQRLQDLHRLGRRHRIHASLCREVTYGVPPEQVIGSSGKLKFEMRDGKPVLIKLPEIEFVDDNVEKPAAIQKHIGRRPIAAFGNSDGDLEMLQWTVAGTGARFALLVHHNDAIRECAYDRAPSIGQLDRAFDEANAKGWTVVDMRNDWRRIFPFE